MPRRPRSPPRLPPPPRRPPQPVQATQDAANGPTSTGNGISDTELLDKARAAKNGPKFTSLFDNGNANGYASISEARRALLRMLASWVGPDPDRLARLYRESALLADDDKFDEARDVH